jgi:hypothetical protein
MKPIKLLGQIQNNWSHKTRIPVGVDAAGVAGQKKPAAPAAGPVEAGASVLVGGAHGALVRALDGGEGVQEWGVTLRLVLVST